MAAYTPESLSHEATLIFMGTPINVETKHLVGDRYVTSARFRVEKRIKGPMAANDTVSVISVDWRDRIDPIDFTGAIAKERMVLVLAKPAQNSFPETEGLYEFVAHRWNGPAFYADAPVQYIYDEEGAAIRSFDELLRRIEAQCVKEAELLRLSWQGSILPRQIAVPWESDVHKEVYGIKAPKVLTIEYVEPKAN